MRKTSWAALGALVGTLVVVGWSSRVQSQPPPPPPQPRPVAPRPLGPLSAEVARSSGVDEETVAKVLNALGPAARQQLAVGRSVALPGLGQMRVVRLGQRKDLVVGRPATLPATNSVEFVPDGTLDAA